MQVQHLQGCRSCGQRRLERQGVEAGAYCIAACVGSRVGRCWGGRSARQLYDTIFLRAGAPKREVASFVWAVSHAPPDMLCRAVWVVARGHKLTGSSPRRRVWARAAVSASRRAVPTVGRKAVASRSTVRPMRGCVSVRLAATLASSRACVLLQTRCTHARALATLVGIAPRSLSDLWHAGQCEAGGVHALCAEVRGNVCVLRRFGC